MRDQSVSCAVIPASTMMRGALFLLAAATLLWAQSVRPPGAEYKGPAFTFNKIQEGVYHAVGTGVLTVGCNAAVIVNPDDVLIVDSHISPAAAWALAEEVRSLTPKPIRYVVNTHFHFDHAHGNQVFPGPVEIIGHEFTREMIAAGKSKSGRSYDFFVGGLPAQLDGLKKRIAAATDAAERTKLQEQLAVTENHLKATAAVLPTPPTITMKETMTIHRGGREIRLLFLGHGHTAGDVIVYLPKERVIATGDLLTAGPSYLGDGFPKEWIETLERVKALDFDTVLPGHGAAFRGKEKIEHFQAYLRDFWNQTEKLHREGVSADEAAKRIDLRAHAKNYPTITEVGVFPHGVVRAYELLEEAAR